MNNNLKVILMVITVILGATNLMGIPAALVLIAIILAPPMRRISQSDIQRIAKEVNTIMFQKENDVYNNEDDYFTAMRWSRMELTRFIDEYLTKNQKTDKD